MIGRPFAVKDTEQEPANRQWGQLVLNDTEIDVKDFVNIIQHTGRHEEADRPLTTIWSSTLT